MNFSVSQMIAHISFITANISVVLFLLVAFSARSKIHIRKFLLTEIFQKFQWLFSFFNFWRTLVGLLVPSARGFESKQRWIPCVLCYWCMMESSDLHLVWHLLSVWLSVWHLILMTHLLFQTPVGVCDLRQTGAWPTEFCGLVEISVTF